jgi:hypothetical protein
MTNSNQIATHNFFFLDFHGHMKSAVMQWGQVAIDGNQGCDSQGMKDQVAS